MSRPTALLAEDELPQRRELRALLQDLWPELEVIAECADGLSALEALQTVRPEVTFLDIRMPGLSGLEVARQGGSQTQLVFTTAYDLHAVRAFQEGAVDYLLKPITRERLQITVDRLRARLGKTSGPDIEPLLHVLRAQLAQQAARGIRWITAGVAGTVKMFPIEDVIFFQARDKYTRVVTRTEEAQIRTPLKELASALDSQEFWQVHRSVIVQVSCISAVRRDADERLELTLNCSAERLPVSAAFRGFKPM